MKLFKQQDPEVDDTPYWKQYRQEKTEKEKFYHDRPKDYFKRYGYNQTRFKYPVRRDGDCFENFKAKYVDESWEYPSELIPEDDPELKCKHGNVYEGGLILNQHQEVRVGLDRHQVLYWLSLIISIMKFIQELMNYGK